MVFFIVKKEDVVKLFEKKKDFLDDKIIEIIESDDFNVVKVIIKDWKFIGIE